MIFPLRGTSVIFEWSGSSHNVDKVRNAWLCSFVTQHCTSDWWSLFGDWRTMKDLFCQKVGSAEDYANCSGITDTTGEGIFFTKEQRPLTFFSHPMCLTGVSGPYTWQAPSSEGNHYFVCGIGIHCSVGNMKAAIEVSNNCWGVWTFLLFDK